MVILIIQSRCGQYFQYMLTDFSPLQWIISVGKTLKKHVNILFSSKLPPGFIIHWWFFPDSSLPWRLQNDAFQIPAPPSYWPVSPQYSSVSKRAPFLHMLVCMYMCLVYTESIYLLSIIYLLWMEIYGFPYLHSLSLVTILNYLGAQIVSNLFNGSSLKLVPVHLVTLLCHPPL